MTAASFASEDSPQDASGAPAFGAYAPRGLVASMIATTRSAPPTRGGRLMSSPLRRLIMARLGARPVDVETFDAKMRLHPSDNLADKRVLIRPQLFDPQEREALASIMHERFAFIDAGANTGMYSLFVATKAGPAAHILAIEPQPIIKERLAYNIAVNGFAQITHADIALADGEGTLTMAPPARNRGATQFQASGKAKAGEISVPTTGLFELMDYQGMTRADALKIDIEGAEDTVMQAFFERCPPERLPLMIIMEILSKTWSVDCVQLAKDAGYETRAENRRNIVLTRV